MLPIKDNKEPGKGGKDKWLARDVRETGGKVHSGEVQKPRKKGPEVCSVFLWVCCGLSRELISNLFGMGLIRVSNKVIGVISWLV